MRRTFLGIALAMAIGLAAVGLSAAVAAADPATECAIERPRWEVSWTSDDADTIQRCGGEAASDNAKLDDANSDQAKTDQAETGEATASKDAAPDELPLTTGPAVVVAVLAAALVTLGAGLYLVARHRRTIFTA